MSSITDRLTRLLLLALGTGCVTPARPADGPTPFQDAEGNPIALTALPVTRIVSTMQSATEWLVALGASDLLVARTDFDRQPELAELPSIGGGLDPSPESVAALHPDVVLGWRNRSSSDLQRALQSFHVPVISLETADTADLFHHLAALGILIGRTARADSLANALREELRDVHAHACAERGSGPQESVMVILATNPAMTSGGGTWLNTIIETACMTNAFGDLAAPWPVVALESVVSRQPDWLLTSGGVAGQRLTELRSLPGWKDLKAVKEGRVLEVSSDLLSRAGPTIGLAARAILTARMAWARE